MRDPTARRANPPRAPRAPGSASPARTGRRTRRTSTSPRGLDERAHRVVILHAWLDLEPGARVDGPRTHRFYGLAHVIGREAAREHHAPSDRACPLEVRRICLLPRKIDDARDT